MSPCIQIIKKCVYCLFIYTHYRISTIFDAMVHLKLMSFIPNVLLTYFACHLIVLCERVTCKLFLKHTTFDKIENYLCVNYVTFNIIWHYFMTKYTFSIALSFTLLFTTSLNSSVVIHSLLVECLADYNKVMN